jgi:hypothetical protein
MLEELVSCTQLQELEIAPGYGHWHGNFVEEAQVHTVAALLAQLPSLVSLSLPNAPAAIAAQLTSLTRLECMHNSGLDAVLTTLPANHHLRSLSIGCCSSRDDDQASTLQCLLTHWPSLTHLGLKDTTINQQGLDALLQYGTSLTSLESCDIEPTQDRSSAPCSWKKLDTSCDGGLLKAAYLPLHSVEQLDWNGRQPMCTYLNMGNAPEGADSIAFLRQAASNLARCPALQRASSSLWLWGVESDPDSDETVESSQVLQALAPLHNLGITSFETDLSHLGAPEVKALADSLGGGLTKLRLPFAEVSPCFWPALSEHLPHVDPTQLRQYAKLRQPPPPPSPFCNHPLSYGRLRIRDLIRWF